MTTELEKQFFSTFEIISECDLPCQKRGIYCVEHNYCGRYPEITTEKLLELICIHNSHICFNGFTFVPKLSDKKPLKDEFMETFIYCLNNKLYVHNCGYVKQEVRKLFERNDNEG